MPSFGHRALLRLRRLPPATSTVAISSTRKSNVRTLATAFHDDSYPSAYHPIDPIMYGSAFSYRSPLSPDLVLRGAGASPVATSSKVTLDTYLNTRTDDALWSALNYARDEELVAAALTPLSPALPPSSRGWLDPASAYLGLRSSSLFSHYLTLVLPRIRTLYANLRPSGMHHLLVSDLLLRNPDPRALREILVEETDSAHRSLRSARLRSGLIAQMYSVVNPSIRRRTVPRLTRPASLAVARALIVEDSLDLIPDVFYELAHTTNWEPEGTWRLLELALHLSRRGRAQDALRLLQYPIALGKLPSNVLGRTSASHPEAATLMVQSAVVRAALSWGFHVRAHAAVNDLVDTMARSSVSQPVVDLILEACRVSAVSRDLDHIAYATQTLLRMASDERFPPLPSSTLDLHYEALPTLLALDFYNALSPTGTRHPPPPPSHILRLALARPTRLLLARLTADLARGTRDPSQHLPGVIRALSVARMLPLARRAYEVYRSMVTEIDAGTVIAIVRAHTRGARTNRNITFAKSVVSDYLATSRVTPQDAALTAIQTFMHIAEVNDTSAVVPHLDTLVQAIGTSRAQICLNEIITRDPLIAHRLASVVRASPFALELTHPGLVVAAACAARHWTALTILSRIDALGLSESDRVYLKALARARKGRIGRALIDFRAAIEMYPADPVLVPVFAALIHRAQGKRKWDAGLDAVQLALANVSRNNADDVVAHTSVFLSELNKEIQVNGRKSNTDTATVAWVLHRSSLRQRADQLDPAPRTFLLSVLDKMPN